MSLKPFDRFQRYCLYDRPLGGFAEDGVVSAVSQRDALLYLSQLSVQKKAAVSFFPETTRSFFKAVRHAPLVAILDSSSLVSLDSFAAHTPATGLDLDVSFTAMKWATEVNTTRRTDHEAKYVTC